MCFLSVLLAFGVVWVDRIGRTLGSENQSVIHRAQDAYLIQGCENTDEIHPSELRQTFFSAYPQHNNNSTALLNLNKRNMTVRGRCSQSIPFTLKQLCRLDNKFGPGYLFNLTTEEMVQNPKARVFWEENFKGSFEDFSKNKTDGMCQNLEQLSRNARSVDTFGTCIRLFQYPQCKGWSLAIYPENGHSKRMLNTLLEKVSSLGPCLTHEFQYASYQDPIKGIIRKNPQFGNYVPDFIMPYFNHRLLDSDVENPSIKYKSQGPHNRTEYLHYSFDRTKIKISTEKPILNNNTFYNSLEKQDGDVLFHAIPLDFGGPPHRTYNVFAASPTSVKQWNAILSKIHLVDLSKKATQILLNFVYDNVNSTRPLYFYYHINCYRGLFHSTYTLYGRILNGNNGDSLTQQPNIQSFGALPKNIKMMGIPLDQLSEKYKHSSKVGTKMHFSSMLINFNQRLENFLPGINCEIFMDFEDTLKESEDLKGNYVPKNYLQDMLSEFPFAVLYTGENFTGASIRHHFTKFEYLLPHCSRLNYKMIVNSAETFGKCIRLHERPNCVGASLAIYPGSEYSTGAMTSGLRTVAAVERCLENEFLNSTFKDTTKRQVLKNPTIDEKYPDFHLRWISGLSQVLTGQRMNTS